METRQAQPFTDSPPDPVLSPAEELPGLYRMVLDRVALLEQIGERPEACQIRLWATAAYSGAWNDAGRHRMVALVGRADRILSNHDRPHGWTLRRRSAPSR
jgi:hypothetical protein